MIQHIPVPTEAEVGQLLSREDERACCQGMSATRARDTGLALGLVMYAASATMCVLSVHVHQRHQKDVDANLYIFMTTGWTVRSLARARFQR